MAHTGDTVEAPIPRHITCIYVFAIVNLLALLCISSVDAEIIVKDTLSNDTAAQYSDLQAKFGPDFPARGLEGKLVYASPDPQACGSLQPPPDSQGEYQWILLVARGGLCLFADKVLNAQLLNYSAVIVHNYEHKEGLIPMGGGINGSKVNIPSTFVGWSDGMELRRLYDYRHREYLVKILEDESVDYTGYLWPFLLVMAICILLVMVFLIIKFVRDQTRRRFSRLLNKHLKKIPVRKFKKGDYYDTCAICLDEYEEGEKIRVLPCQHVYHRKCIDPWLTKNKKTCPVCKRRVMPGKDADSESESESDNGNVAAGASESTPLLMGRPVGSYGHLPVVVTIQGTPIALSMPEPQSFPVAAVETPVVVENGAVGGMGISDQSYKHQDLRLVSGQGNIQDQDVHRQAHTEHRPGRSAGERSRTHEQARQDDAGLSHPSREQAERRKRKSKKKEKRVSRRAQGLEHGHEKEHSSQNSDMTVSGAGDNVVCEVDQLLSTSRHNMDLDSSRLDQIVVHPSPDSRPEGSNDNRMLQSNFVRARETNEIV